MDPSKYDTSNFPELHPQYNVINKKVPGKMKDEGAGKPIVEFAALRSKSYCAQFQEFDLKRHKGVKRYVVKDWRLDMYKECLFTSTLPPSCEMNILQSKLHDIKTTTITKKTLSPFDDK